jgi:hypothetical protein
MRSAGVARTQEQHFFCRFVHDCFINSLSCSSCSIPSDSTVCSITSCQLQYSNWCWVPKNGRSDYLRLWYKYWVLPQVM